MATAAEWWSAARPRTLPAAAAPVLVGTGAAAQAGGAHLGRAVLALGVGLAIQVGANYANDYSDGVRGTDVNRVGPMRLVASGAAPPAQVKAAAVGVLAAGALLGIWLVAWSGVWWLLAAGVAAVVAAWTYTGGRRPYGYAGFGEVGVFVFFGLFAVLGTTASQLGRTTWPAWLGAVAVGLLACALIMANNVRDVPTDVLASKRTLAVRLGETKARWLYAVFVVAPIPLGAACAFAAPWSLLVVLCLGPAVALAVAVLVRVRGRGLIPVLTFTGQLELVFAILLAIGLAV